MTDRNWNTVPERWVQLNARGQISSEWVDANEDSAPERSRSFDAAGRLTEEGIDADGDGLFEVTRTFNTRWPPGSGPLRIERDEDRDGVNERRESYTVTGALRSANDDTDGDGVRDHISLFLARRVAAQGGLRPRRRRLLRELALPRGRRTSVARGLRRRRGLRHRPLGSAGRARSMVRGPLRRGPERRRGRVVGARSCAMIPGRGAEHGS